MDLKETYNKIAEDWHRDHQDDSWWMEGTDRFIELVGSGASVLDAGCGGGTKSKYLLEKGLKVSGIDLSEKMIEIARREVSSGTFFVKDILSEDIGETFDGIYSQAVFLHIPRSQIGLALGKLFAALKKEGYIYLSVKRKKEDDPDEEIREEADYGYSYQRFFSYFTEQELVDYVKRAGFKIVYTKIIPTGKSSWIQVIAQKS